MWNCSTIFTRNRSLCNSTANLAKKDVYLKPCVTSVVRQRSLKTHALSTHEHSGGREVEKSVWNRILSTHNYQTFKYVKVEETSLKYLSTRRFHTFPTSYCADTKVDNLSSQSSDARKLDSKMIVSSLFTEDNTTHKNETSSERKIANESISSKSFNPKYSMKDIEKMYPNPKGSVHAIYQIVKNERKSTEIDFTFSQLASNAWLAKLDVSWPEQLSFIGKGTNKNGASTVASLKCLEWLENNKNIIKGKPVIYDTKEIHDILKKPVMLSMKRGTLVLAKNIIDKYKDNIEPIIQSQSSALNINRNSFQDGAIVDPVGNSNPANRFPDRIKKRNELLQSRIEICRSERPSTNLPIMEFREQIIESIEKNNVLVIKGDTGCGKTTQVPQFIMDNFAERGCATDCNIIVSQPRRISAISLVERIANERMEQVGDVLGYQVRLTQELPNTPGGILFCTNGILLRKLQCNPTLEGCSHVIIDEAHERTINTDMLLTLLKRALQQRPSLKIIIMSATINAELFQNYFNCNVIEVPGRLYPVEMNFLEDINKLNLPLATKWDTNYENPNESEISIDLTKMGELISYICRDQPPGAILCFLPGWAEISKMKKYLEEYCYFPSQKIMILPIHSKMSHIDQRKIFSKPPHNVRKIVLATDIAETGITVADVVYVVDSCTRKQIQWDEKRHLSIIENQWASQANINQRKGRAGRVRPGISYHFITREKFNQLPQYPDPEIKCLSLEKTVLDAKTYSNEKAVDFLSAFPQPPPQRTVQRAVQDLIDLGALDDNENLTPLGVRIAFIALTPQLSKAMVYSSIFQCLSPMVSIASIMTGEIEMFSGVLEHKANMRAVKSKFHPASDHLALAWLFQQWYTLENFNHLESRALSTKHRLNHEKIYTLSKIREINAEQLYRARMLSNLFALNDISAEDNKYAEMDELCRGVLLSGLNNILYKRDNDFKKGQFRKGVQAFITDDGSRATITPDSINFNRKHWPSPFMTYVRRTHSEERRTSLIRDTSIISPLTVFLFNQSRIVMNLYNTPDTKNCSDSNNNIKNSSITNDDYDITNNNIRSNEKRQVLFTIDCKPHIRLLCDEDVADVLLNFRDSMWNVVRYMVANYGVTNNDNIEEYKQVDEFKTEMLQVLVKMLNEASESIDSPILQKNEDANFNEIEN